MNEIEFAEIGKYAASLWAKFTLTPEQASMWSHKLRHYHNHDVKSAFSELYARKSRYAPDLDEVLDLLRKWKQAAHVVDQKHDAEAVKAEQQQHEREYAADLATLRANYTADELERCRAEILRREPHTDKWCKLPVESPWWVALITQRYVRGVAQVKVGNAWAEYPVDAVWQTGKAVAA